MTIKQSIPGWTLLLLAFVAVWSAATAQLPDPSSAAAAARQPLGAEQLDQLTAPIALYSDPLLGAVLTGSTYPLEIVEAARWLEDPANAALKGDSLAAAMQQQPWDPSVKSLVGFPDVLRTMNQNLQWTEQLGDAFLAQQGDVMDSVQRLRQRASAAGSLRTTPQQVVSDQNQYLSIQPAAPDVVYVPYYDPMIVYGLWPWAAYPPYYFGIAPGIVFDGALIGFGIGIGIGYFGPYWGGWGWDWGHHGLYYRPHGPRGGPDQPWRHDPAHRGGVPYRDSATSARYGEAAARARDVYRGYARGTATGGGLPRTDMASPHTGAPMPRVAAPMPRVATPMPREAAPMPRESAPMPRMEPTMPRPAAPAFESFGHGPQVRGEAARGYSSRSSPAPRPSGAGSHHP